MPRGIHGSYEVRFEARIPKGVASHVSTTNGSLKVSDLNGRLKASVVNGGIEAARVGGDVDLADVNGSMSASLSSVTAPVRLDVTNGRIRLELPRSVKANLSARVVNGSLSVSGLPIEQPPQRRIKTLEVSLNGGGPPIDLHATNGAISVEGK